MKVSTEGLEATYEKGGCLTLTLTLTPKPNPIPNSSPDSNPNPNPNPDTEELGTHLQKRRVLGWLMEEYRAHT